VCRIAGGKLEKTGETIVDAGAGPRHMVLHPTRYLAAGGGKVNLETCYFKRHFCKSSSVIYVKRASRNITLIAFNFSFSVIGVIFSRKLFPFSRNENLPKNQPYIINTFRNLAVLACELKSLVNLYSVDEQTGALTLLQQVSRIEIHFALFLPFHQK
jgi:hypothetical protein